MHKALPFLLLFFTVAQASQVNDIQEASWGESVNYLLQQGIVQGYPDGSFKPKNTINRAEFTKIIIGSLYEPEALEDVSANCFPDVKANDWFASYVCLAKEEGVINGYPDGTFRPAQIVNQAEALKILYESFYEDIEPSPGQWYQTYLDEAEYDGMLYFEPNNPAAHLVTREEMAYFTAWLLDEDGELSEEISYTNFYGEDYQDTDFGWEYDEGYLDQEGFEDDSDLYAENTPDVTHQEDFDFSDIPAYVRYDINSNNITLQHQQLGLGSTGNLENTDIHQTVWQRFTTLIPVEFRNNFSAFALFDDAESGTAAYVEPQGGNIEKWLIAINLSEVYDEDGAVFDAQEFDLTLIHEFAHVMTLNDKQVESVANETTCRVRLLLEEGCARSDAFINIFFKKFWNRQQQDAAEQDPERLYEQKSTHFITEYAATNVGEDIAETFAYFIGQAKPAECRSSITNQKLCFFYEFPSLVKLRSEIRKVMIQK